jgi:abortive infection bacteriophage resistance protein
MGTKPFLSVEDQILNLKNRNLRFDNEDVAKNILLRENYYNVINGYKLPFIKKDLKGNLSVPESYISNCEFDEIYALYNLDRELRLLILGSLLKFETHLKTSCAYNFSEKYQEAYSYLNVSNYSNDKKDLSAVLRNLAALSGQINRNTNSRNPKTLYIGHYIANHESVPLWVLVNTLTIGNMSYFYNSLDVRLKEVIARDFSEQFKREYLSTEKIESGELQQIIKTINLFRNVCAHEEILFLFKLKRRVKSTIFNKYFKSKDFDVKVIERSDLFTLILLLKLVMLKDDYLKLVDNIDEIFNKYRDKFKSVSFNDVIELSGFANEWEKNILENL